MSNARTLADLMGTSTTIPQSKVNLSLAASDLPSGSVLQVKSFTYTGTQSFNDADEPRMASDLVVSITPTSSTSKMLITASLAVGFSNSPEWSWYVSREVSGGSTTDFLGAASVVGNRMRGYHGGPRDQNGSDMTNEVESYSNTLLDSPATTSAINYRVCFQNRWTNTYYFYLNRSGGDSNNGYITRGISTITVMEIAG